MRDLSHAASMRNQSGALRVGTQAVIRIVGAGTLPFALPRLRSPVHDNLHRYHDMHSEAVRAGADEVCQGFDFLTVACFTILLLVGNQGSCL
jgi:hypothetical protein